ncbi:hypothetical protein D3C77_689160 [compost metagenome]
MTRLKVVPQLRVNTATAAKPQAGCWASSRQRRPAMPMALPHSRMVLALQRWLSAPNRKLPASDAAPTPAYQVEAACAE